jgi:ferric-dicitrate binding protein FerR (iron transport regulator)
MVAATVAVGVRFAFHKSSVSSAEEKSVQTVTQVEEKSAQPLATVTFENTALADIVKQIADYHHVGISIRNAEAAKLRLYFQWNRQDALSETLDMLNRFERFSIVQAADGTLVVE